MQAVPVAADAVQSAEETQAAPVDADKVTMLLARLADMEAKLVALTAAIPPTPQNIGEAPPQSKGTKWSTNAGEVVHGNKVPFTHHDLVERTGEVSWYNWTRFDHCIVMGVPYRVPVNTFVTTPGIVKAHLEETEHAQRRPDFVERTGGHVATGALEGPPPQRPA